MHPAGIIYCTAAAPPDQLVTPGGRRIAARRTVTHELFPWLTPLIVLQTSQWDPDAGMGVGSRSGIR